MLFIEIFPDALARLLWCIIILQPVDGKVDDFLVDFFCVAVLKSLPTLFSDTIIGRGSGYSFLVENAWEACNCFLFLFVEDVGVDLCCLDIGVAEKLAYGVDVGGLVE